MLASIYKWFEVILFFGHQDIQVSVKSVKSAKRSEPVQAKDEGVNSSHWIVTYQISQVMFSLGGVDARCTLFPFTTVFSIEFSW